MSGTTTEGSRIISALLPRGAGHQFVVYGDACSGIPGAPHEQTFAEVSAVVRRLAPAPEFIIFPGDEISGLTPDEDQLRAQWRYWIDHETRWLDRRAIPMWHSTANHTTYDEMSERVFRDVLAMPKNGPPGQEGLTYWVRRGDLLLIFVHTLWTGLGGEGFVETKWLDEVLGAHADATHKIVVGHHPAFPVNGFSGPYQRDIDPDTTTAFWDTLVKHGVRAYICSHILAFDIQAHRGVLQICSAGAGTAHRMPEGIEYLHCVQMALDAQALRYQVLDVAGRIREALDWPFDGWQLARQMQLPHGAFRAPLLFPEQHRLMELQFTGTTADDSRAQTLLCTCRDGELAPIWIGLRGAQQRLTVIVQHATGRSPHYWIGPALGRGTHFDIRLLLHADMGPGGFMCRMPGDTGWTSMSTASSWGLERLKPSMDWLVGRSADGADDRPFRGASLEASLRW